MRVLKIFTVLVVAVFASTAMAADDYYNWKVGSGTYSTSGNWNPAGPPPADGNDIAFFDFSATGPSYTVSFDADETCDEAVVGIYDVTFDLNGYTYTLEGIGDQLSDPPDYDAWPKYLCIGLGSDTASLTILDGTVASGTDGWHYGVRIGEDYSGTPSNGTLTVGADGILDMSQGGENIYVGVRGNAYFNIVDGGTVNLASMVVMGGSQEYAPNGDTFVMTIEDPGSSVSCFSITAGIDNDTNSDINILAGGQFTSTVKAKLGTWAGSTGCSCDLLIDGTNSTFTVGDQNTSIRGTLVISNGGKWDSSGEVDGNPNNHSISGEYTIGETTYGSSAEIGVTGAGTMLVNNLYIGDNSSTEQTTCVLGANSVVTIGGRFQVDVDDKLTIQGGAAVTTSGYGITVLGGRLETDANTVTILSGNEFINPIEISGREPHGSTKGVLSLGGPGAVGKMIVNKGTLDFLRYDSGSSDYTYGKTEIDFGASGSHDSFICHPVGTTHEGETQPPGTIDLEGATLEYSLLTTGVFVPTVAGCMDFFVATDIVNYGVNGWQHDPGVLEQPFSDNMVALLAAANGAVGYPSYAYGIVTVDSDDYVGGAYDGYKALRLSVLPADADLGGLCDGADLLTWQNGYTNGDTTWDKGDYNLSGLVDGPDLLIWQNNYGKTLGDCSGMGATGATGAAAAVPEPMTLVLLGLGGLAILRRRVR